jgi:sterol carrier protein 2
MGVMAENRGFEPTAPGAAQIFGNAGIEYMEKYGATPTHLAKIAEKNHRHRYGGQSQAQIRNLL